MSQRNNDQDDNKSNKVTVNRLIREWLAGGTANAITSSFLNPMDVSKTRLQSISIAKHQKAQLRQVFFQLYAEGGVIGLWTPGLLASCMREMLNSGARAGFYTSIRDEINRVFNIQHSKQDHLLPKIAASMLTGTLGALLANPVDVVKIRMMTNPKTYPSTFHAFPIIIQSEGVLALYKGLIPSTLRGAFISAGELASYDHSKTILKSYFQVKEGIPLHIGASLITGMIATTVAAPFDMVKTRAMNSTTTTGFHVITLFVNIIKNEGPLALFRGWIPSYLRLGPHALICFPIFEQIRRVLGLDYF